MDPYDQDESEHLNIEFLTPEELREILDLWLYADRLERPDVELSLVERDDGGLSVVFWTERAAFAEALT